MTNKIIIDSAQKILSNFIKYPSFDFNKEVTEKIVKEYGVTVKDIQNIDNDTLIKFMQAGLESSYIYPLFDIKGKNVLLKSQNFFEINRFALIISSFVKGIDQYISAKTINKDSANQFKIFAYYSSSFQLITSFLALHNIVYIPKGLSEINIKTIEKNVKKDGTYGEILNWSMDEYNFIRGIYNGMWEFSLTQPGGHRNRWRDFSEILKKYLRNNWEKQIPDGVERFWAYIKCLAEYSKNFWRDKYSYTISFKNKKEFIKTLNNNFGLPSKIRHEKIYENRYYDLISYSFVKQKKPVPQEFVDAEISFFDDFSKDMILWVFAYLRLVLNEIEKGMEKSEYYKALNLFKQNVILSISETSYLNLKKNESEINKIDKLIMPFLDLIFS